jgi:hypothetical protein
VIRPVTGAGSASDLLSALPPRGTPDLTLSLSLLLIASEIAYKFYDDQLRERLIARR